MNIELHDTVLGNIIYCTFSATEYYYYRTSIQDGCRLKYLQVVTQHNYEKHVREACLQNWEDNKGRVSIHQKERELVKQRKAYKQFNRSITGGHFSAMQAKHASY